MARKHLCTLITMGVLYGVILLLPYVIRFEQDWFAFLEQPLTILIPTLTVTVYHTRRKGISLRHYYPRRSLRLMDLLLLTCIVLMLPALCFYVADAFSFLYPEMSEEQLLLTPGSENGFAYSVRVFLYNTVFLAIFPGICEELLFRGSMLEMMKEVGWSDCNVILTNAVLFGLFHGNLAQFFYTTALGVVLTAVVLATHSLYAGIFVHTLYNFLVSLQDIVLVEQYPRLQQLVVFIEHMDTLPFALCSVIVIVLAIKRLQYRNNTFLQ